MMSTIELILWELFGSLAEFVGKGCAILVLFVLPVVIPVSFFIELDTGDSAKGLTRGVKVAGVFVVAAALSCLGSILWHSGFGVYFSGFGIGLVHVVVIAAVVVLSRVSTR